LSYYKENILFLVLIILIQLTTKCLSLSSSIVIRANIYHWWILSPRLVLHLSDWSSCITSGQLLDDPGSYNFLEQFFHPVETDQIWKICWFLSFSQENQIGLLLSEGESASKRQDCLNAGTKLFHSKESNLPETPSDPGAFAAEPSCYLYLLGRDPEFLGSPLL